nr:hypothetical protein [Bifidobacterium crudilactis]
MRLRKLEVVVSQEFESPVAFKQFARELQCKQRRLNPIDPSYSV